MNKGVVNSMMYKHQAEHFTNIHNLGPAIKCLKIGRVTFFGIWGSSQNKVKKT